MLTFVQVCIQVRMCIHGTCMYVYMYILLVCMLLTTVMQSFLDCLHQALKLLPGPTVEHYPTIPRELAKNSTFAV